MFAKKFRTIPFKLKVKVLHLLFSCSVKSYRLPSAVLQQKYEVASGSPLAKLYTFFVLYCTVLYCTVPVIVPLLAEGDLDAELHPHVVNLLEAPHEEVDPDQGGAVAAVLARPRLTSGHVHRLALQQYQH